MTHLELKAARHKLGLSVAQMAALLGVGPVQVRRMEMAPGKSTSREISPMAALLVAAYLAGYRPRKGWPG